jgi:hypothetical protein
MGVQMIRPRDLTLRTRILTPEDTVMHTTCSSDPLHTRTTIITEQRRARQSKADPVNEEHEAKRRTGISTHRLQEITFQGTATKFSIRAYPSIYTIYGNILVVQWE